MCLPPPTPLIHRADWRLTIAGAPGLPLVKAQQKIPLQRGSTQQNEERICSSDLPTCKCLSWWGLLCGIPADRSTSLAMKPPAGPLLAGMEQQQQRGGCPEIPLVFPSSSPGGSSHCCLDCLHLNKEDAATLGINSCGLAIKRNRIHPRDDS